MKTVIQINKKSKNINIVFDDESELTLSEDTFTDYYFYIGKSFEDKEIKEIEEKENIVKYKIYCSNLLLRKEYSTSQIKDKLKAKKLNKEQIDLIISYLIDINLLNDKRFVVDLIESLENKGYGYYRIKEKIKDLSLNYDYEYNEELEIKRAISNLDNLVKKYSFYSYNKMKNSIYNSLVSLGFKEEVIKVCLNNINKDKIKELEKEKIRKEFVLMTFKYSKNEIKQKKDKIIHKLLMHGFSYNDIIETIDGEF